MARERKPVALKPVDWTPDLWAAILERIRKGAAPGRAALAEGVPVIQWGAWTNESGTEQSRQWAREVLQAEAVAECSLVEQVRIGEQNWRAASWLLERRWPERWSEARDKQGTEGPLQVVVRLADEGTESE